MKKETLDLTRPVFVAINGSRGEWGRSNDAATAKKIARVRKADKFRVYRVEGIEGKPLTADDLNPHRNGGLRYEGYAVGDLLKPWVNNYGGLVANGTVTVEEEAMK